MAGRKCNTTSPFIFLGTCVYPGALSVYLTSTEHHAPLIGHIIHSEMVHVALRVGGGEAAASSEGVAVATAAKAAEEFWRRQLVPKEDIQRLDELYPVRRSPGEAVPPDQVSQVSVVGHCSCS